MSADAAAGAERALTDVATASLERIRAGLQSGALVAPVTRSALVAFGVTLQIDALLSVLEGHPVRGCIAILQAVLAERRELLRPAPELVWTGPEGTRATARDTAVVLRSLFEQAERRVILAGYSFDNPEAVLRPLHDAMLRRGVQAVFFVDIDQPGLAQSDEVAYGRAQLEAFRRINWPFGPPYPELHCDRRALSPGRGGEYCSLHAKCVSVDGQRAFVSSANFTMRAHERNIEVGVLLHDPAFASQLERQWMSLLEEGLVLSAE